MKIKLNFALLVCVVVFCSCATRPATPPKWTAKKEGIILHLKSDNKLNLKNNKAYTLYLVLYQLTNPNAFNQLTADKKGLSKLLASRMFDPSVVGIKSIIVYPGTDVTYKLDRAEGSRYVGLAAGYMVMDKDKMTRVFNVPVKIKKKNIFGKVKSLEPGLLEIDLKLGPKQIEEAKEKE